ncbi:MAG: folate family ECF transporter S component [Breznakia sp.]
MNLIIVQGFSFASLVLIFLYTFQKYPINTKQIKYMIYAAFFVLLNVVLNAIAPLIPFFGVPSVKISLSLLPLMIGGALLPPSWAFLLGFVSDVIGLLITPTSFPFFGFTLNHVLAAVLPSLWYQKNKTLHPKIVERGLYVVSILIATITSVYIFCMDSVVIAQEIFVIRIAVKSGIVLFIWCVTLFMLGIIYVLRQRMKDELVSEFIKWVVASFVVSILLSVILTPTWLSVMYEKPWFVFAFLQVVKTCILIPVYILLGFSVMKMMKKYIGE